MKNDRDLRVAYRDLLGDDPTGELLALIARLDAALAPSASDLPPDLVARIDRVATGWGRRPTRERRLRRWRPSLLRAPRRARVAAVALVAAFCLLGAGYGLRSGLDHLIAVHTGTAAIASRHLGQEVNASRTIQGFTVSVRQVYADPNQIAIGLTVSGPPGRTFNNIVPWGDLSTTPGHQVATSPILTDDQGRELRGGLGGEQGGVVDGTAAYLLTYDGSGIPIGRKQIDVRLTIGKLTAYEALGANRYRDVTVDGPFTFDLTIPVEPGRVASLNLVAESGGVPVTLERVVTAPTGTRVSLRGAGPDAVVQLTAGSQTYRLHPPDGQAAPASWAVDSRWDYVTGASLVDWHGESTLTVQPGPSAAFAAGRGAGQPGAGSWTFRLVLP